MQLNGRAALITGGRRIGVALAAALAAHGADVALTFHRSKEDAEKGAAEVRAAGRRAVLLHRDLTDPAECAAAVDEAAERLGRLDVLVNMASVYRAAEFDSLTVEDWQRVLDVDLRAAFVCAKTAVPYMRAAGAGRIINFSDWVAASGRPRYKGYVPYYVAKRAVIGLTEALSLELAAEQILVNAIAPGPILAPEGTTVEEHAAVERATPVGRWGGAEEICKAVLFLIESDFVTGETLRVDGGRHVK